MAQTIYYTPFSSLSGWTNASVAPNTATIETDGPTFLQLYGGAASGFPNAANVYRTVTVPPKKFTMEFQVYHTVLGTVANFDHCTFALFGDAYVRIVFASNQVTCCGIALGDLAKHDGNAAWQVWRFEVKNQSVWIFLDNVFINRVECEGKTANPGRAQLIQSGWSIGAKTRFNYLNITSTGGIASPITF